MFAEQGDAGSCPARVPPVLPAQTGRRGGWGLWDVPSRFVNLGRVSASEGGKNAGEKK